MGLSYVARFSATDDIDTVARHLAREFQFHADPQHCGRTPLVPTVTLVATYFEIDITKADQTVQEISAEDLHITIDTTIRFYVWKNFSTHSEGGKLVAAVVDSLLEKYVGDLVFLFNWEQVLLIRSQSKVVINSTAGFWNPVTKSAVRSPFEQEPLPHI